MRKSFWGFAEADLPKPEAGESLADAFVLQSNRLRQRTGRICIWAAIGVGIAWTVVLAPHCWALMSEDPSWQGARAVWLVVSAPPVALIAVLLGLAERFFTPAHLLHANKKSPDDTADEFSKYMGAGGNVVKSGLEKLVENATK